MKYILTRGNEKVYNHKKSNNERGFTYFYFKNKKSINKGDRIVVLYTGQNPKIEYVLEVDNIFLNNIFNDIKDQESIYWNDYDKYISEYKDSKIIVKGILLHKFDKPLLDFNKLFNEKQLTKIQIMKYYKVTIIYHFTNY